MAKSREQDIISQSRLNPHTGLLEEVFLPPPTEITRRTTTAVQKEPGREVASHKGKQKSAPRQGENVVEGEWRYAGEQPKLSKRQMEDLGLGGEPIDPNTPLPKPFNWGKATVIVAGSPLIVTWYGLKAAAKILSFAGTLMGAGSQSEASFSDHESNESKIVTDPKEIKQAEADERRYEEQQRKNAQKEAQREAERQKDALWNQPNTVYLQPVSDPSPKQRQPEGPGYRPARGNQGPVERYETGDQNRLTDGSKRLEEGQRHRLLRG